MSSSGCREAQAQAFWINNSSMIAKSSQGGHSAKVKVNMRLLVGEPTTSAWMRKLVSR